MTAPVVVLVRCRCGGLPPPYGRAVGRGFPPRLPLARHIGAHAGVYADRRVAGARVFFTVALGGARVAAAGRRRSTVCGTRCGARAERGLRLAGGVCCRTPLHCVWPLPAGAHGLLGAVGRAQGSAVSLLFVP